MVCGELEVGVGARCWANVLVSVLRVIHGGELGTAWALWDGIVE